jgi:dTDP-4-amino-4,6-dideoxygalactose transaminase
VREAITAKTKAISWVNYAGVAPDIEGLKNLAEEFGLLLIEDNAHGLGGTYKGKPLGSFGDFAAQSFHATKNIQCGEGGAFVINNPKFIERAEIIREKGTDRSRFMRGEVQKYQWVDQGSSYLLAELLAAQLLGQLESFESIQSKRNQIFTSYFEQLTDWAGAQGFELPFVDKQDLHTSHMFYLVANTPELRNSLIQKLSNFKIQAMFHYQSLADSTFGINYTKAHKSLSVSNKMSNQLVRLPLYHALDLDTQTQIIKRVVE